MSGTTVKTREREQVETEDSKHFHRAVPGMTGCKTGDPCIGECGAPFIHLGVWASVERGLPGLCRLCQLAAGDA